MRAMSLAMDEGESEQNEMRSLQEKLESTTRLVFTLSQQLSELKEQVRLVKLDELTQCARSVSTGKKNCDNLKFMQVLTSLPRLLSNHVVFFLLLFFSNIFVIVFPKST